MANLMQLIRVAIIIVVCIFVVAPCMNAVGVCGEACEAGMGGLDDEAAGR